MGNVYVTSHLDGELKVLETILEKIQFTPDDDLYIIGGLFSTKNKPVTPILKYIRERANIHYIPNEIDAIYINFCNASSLAKKNINTSAYEEKKIFYKKMIEKKCGPYFPKHIALINEKDENNEFPNWEYLKRLKEEQIVYVNGNLFLLTAGAPVKEEKDREELRYKRVTETPKNEKYLITTEAGMCVDFVTVEKDFQCMKDELEELNQRSVTIITASVPTYKLLNPAKEEVPMPIIDTGNIIYINTGNEIEEETNGYIKVISILDLSNNKIMYFS